jgi:hypothetical protein
MLPDQNSYLCKLEGGGESFLNTHESYSIG